MPIHGKKSEIGVPESVGRTILELRAEELRLKREARNAEVGQNLKTAVADLERAFPWEAELRQISPVSPVHSHLRAYWYRAGQRWVLYDVLPIEAIVDDADTGSGLTGLDLKRLMAGKRPSELSEWVPISDVQHAMWQKWHGYARPFWVLQGNAGGHQVNFSPAQSSALLRMGLPSAPPRVGELPPCPFDNRAIHQLQHLNRLHQYEDSIERLRRSGSPEFAAAEQDRIEREVREAEIRFVEQQVRPLVDMAGSISQRSELESELIEVPSGTASTIKDAWEQYRETGNWPI